MKIIFEETDKIVEEKYASGELHGLANHKGPHSINIRINDPMKANVFLTKLFYDPDLASEIGFDVTSFNYYPAISISMIKDVLTDAMTLIETEEKRFY